MCFTMRMIVASACVEVCAGACGCGNCCAVFFLKKREEKKERERGSQKHEKNKKKTR